MKVTFTTQQIVAHKELNLVRELSMVSLGAPTDAGAFSGDANSNDVYFTPSMVALARPLIEKNGGAECSAPKASDAPIKLLGDALGDFPFAPEA